MVVGTVLGIAFLVGSGMVSLIVAGLADYVACWVAWQITGEEGYMQAGWVFALVAWPVLWFLSIGLVALWVKRHQRRHMKVAGFPVVEKQKAN